MGYLTRLCLVLLVHVAPVTSVDEVCIDIGHSHAILCCFLWR